MINDLRSNPSPEWIESIRAQYPVEPTVDKALTMKLKKRGTVKYEHTPLEDIKELLERYLSDKLNAKVGIKDLARTIGGASQEQYMFVATAPEAEKKFGPDRKLILRHEPPESTVRSYRLREFQLINACKDIMPVPEQFYVDPEGEFFGRPASIGGFVEGVQKSANVSVNVSALGMWFPPDIRESVGRDFVRYMAKMHTLDLKGKDLSAFTMPEVGSKQSTIDVINWGARLWAEDRLEEAPLMNMTRQWLIKNAPELDHVSIVHGDYRSGNFLFDEKEKKITAILDWELGYLGDRHSDLSWVTFEPYACFGEQGELLCVGLFKKDDFIKLYEQESGFKVDEWRLKYFKILNLWKTIGIATAAGARAAAGEKSHQDILMAWIATIGYPMLGILRNLLVEAMTEKEGR